MNKNNENNILLLDEAYKNVRMASFAIDCIIEKIENKSLEDLLRKQNEFYLNATKRLDSLSKQFNHTPKDINLFLKSTSFVAIKTKTMMNNDTEKFAEMLVQGTTMGITDTIKAKGEHPVNNEELLAIVDDIVSHEEEFVDSLKKYLIS
jgi:hypothetical protein